MSSSKQNLEIRSRPLPPAAASAALHVAAATTFRRALAFIGACRDADQAVERLKRDTAIRLPAERMQMMADAEHYAWQKAGFAGVQRQAPRWQVMTSPGTGKTFQMIKEAAKVRGNYVILFTFQTSDKAREAFEDYQCMAKPDSLPAMLARGRSGETCQRSDLARRLGQAGGSPLSLCKRRAEGKEQFCQHLASCGYQAQWKEAHAKRHALIIFTVSAYLFVASHLPQPDLVIADEALPCSQTHEMPVKAFLDAAGVVGVGAEADDVVLALRDRTNDLARLATLISGDKLAGMSEAAATWLKDAAWRVDPRRPNNDITPAVDRIGIAGVGKLKSLIDQLKIELPHGEARPRLNSILLDSEMIRWATFRRPKVARTTPVIHLDATADLALSRDIWSTEDLRVIEIWAKRKGKFIQVNKSFSKQSLLGINSDGEEVWPEDARKLRRDLFHFLAALGPTFACASKSIVDSLLWPMNVQPGHFGHVRGLNVWAHLPSAAIIGRELPRPADIELLAGAQYADSDEQIERVGSYKKAVRSVRLKNGGSVEIMVDVHPDIRVQRWVEQAREAELIQALDRVRATRATRTIWLMCSVALDSVEVDEVISWPEAQRRMRRAAAIAEGVVAGVLPAVIDRTPVTHAEVPGGWQRIQYIFPGGTRGRKPQAWIKPGTGRSEILACLTAMTGRPVANLLVPAAPIEAAIQPAPSAKGEIKVATGAFADDLRRAIKDRRIDPKRGDHDDEVRIFDLAARYGSHNPFIGEVPF